MSKILYVVDDNKNKNYKYNIEEDTIIYHFSINSSHSVLIDLVSEGVSVWYYYYNINYSDNEFSISIRHLSSNSHSEVFNHGVNVFSNKLKFIVSSTVPSDSYSCICNQDNQIINMQDGKSTIVPNLFIDNYDVDSSHAAYIGKFLDEDLFYLMSRGIKLDVAYRLLLRGFLGINQVSDESLISKFILEIEKI